MARAKRTARADARRRYRADQALVETSPAEPGEPVEAASSRSTEGASRGTTPAPGARRGVAAAFRESFRPIDLPGDIRAFPITARNKALWIPILLTLASVVVYIGARSQAPDSPITLISRFLFEYFVVTPAIGAAFIAGFLAPRASWLLGAIVGVFSAACYSFLGLGGYIALAPGAPQPVARDVVIAAFTIGPILGAFFASAAAWYRRFLMLSNPNRGRARRPASAPRRPDGRSRAADSGQKAGARR